MARHTAHSSSDSEPLEDKTAALTLRSKRTSRQQRKQTKLARKRSTIPTLSKLPTEILIDCLKVLQPGDVLNFGLVNRRFRALVAAHANIIGNSIIGQRYTILAQCFPLPKPLAQVDPEIRTYLVDSKRQRLLGIHHKPYQHVHPPNADLVCTCLTCIMTWNNLCLALDFAHWQHNLDSGEPLPIIPRGQSPDWSQELVRRNAGMVRAALSNSLWYARILEMHLNSTVRSIRRHAKNMGNRRKHVDMTDEDAVAGTDAFLAKPGPPSLEFPYNRDEYYMLEAYLPNRFWKRDYHKWLYTIAGQHERDLEFVVRLRNTQP